MRDGVDGRRERSHEGRQVLGKGYDVVYGGVVVIFVGNYVISGVSVRVVV